MDQRSPKEFILDDVFADPASVKDVVKGVLHSIFFHRYFPTIRPRCRGVLSLTLPFVDDVELETMIEQRAAALERQLDSERTASASSNTTGGRGQVTVKFFERKRRKGAWIMRGDEEICWECWTVKVTVAEPKTESERAKVRQAMETTLLGTIRKIVRCASERDHIPPITATGQNPFPYQISVNQKQQPDPGWAARMGLTY